MKLNFLVGKKSFLSLSLFIEDMSDFSLNEKNILNFRFAIDQYNKKGESHLIFIEYVNGTRVYIPIFESSRHPVWVLQLNAKNCSEAGILTALYVARVAENPADGGQIQAYGSNFTYLIIEKA